MPADVRANIIALTDMDGDGYVSQEEFLQLANGRNIPGFNRRRRRALRELLKQTVEFIVSHTDCFSTNVISTGHQVLKLVSNIECFLCYFLSLAKFCILGPFQTFISF